MIEPKIIEAWQRLLIPTVMAYPMAEAMHVIANAYVEAEARARQVEHQLDCPFYTFGVCNDPRHKWMLADWEKAVREELEK